MSMWSSGNWSLQQAAYANIPANEVDWGSLAKQWITQRETILPETFNQPPPPPPPPPPESYGIDSSAAPAVPSDSAVTQPQPQQLHYGDPTLAPPGWGWGGWGGIPGWNMPPAPVPVVMPSTDNGSIEYSGYSGFGAGYDTASYDQYWNQSAASQPAGPFVATNDQAMNKFLYPGPLSRGESALISDDLGIDSAKRRQLPAWIREGLEKVEREKQKMLEKERRETEPQLIDSEAFNNYNKEDNSQATKDRAEIVEPETYPRRHSRFDTSDNEGSEHSDAERPSFVRRKTPSPEPMSEEEKQAQLMIRIRQMLTEVLLDVTNSELTSIANEVYSKERAKKAKAPAMPIARSAALASLTSLGLGYESDDESESDEAEQVKTPFKESDSEDEQSLRDRIAKKRYEFERKMREMEEDDKEFQRKTHLPESFRQSKEKNSVEIDKSAALSSKSLIGNQGLLFRNDEEIPGISGKFNNDGESSSKKEDNNSSESDDDSDSSSSSNSSSSLRSTSSDSKQKRYETSKISHSSESKDKVRLEHDKIKRDTDSKIDTNRNSQYGSSSSAKDHKSKTEGFDMKLTKENSERSKDEKRDKKLIDADKSSSNNKLDKNKEGKGDSRKETKAGDKSKDGKSKGKDDKSDRGREGKSDRTKESKHDKSGRSKHDKGRDSDHRHYREHSDSEDSRSRKRRRRSSSEESYDYRSSQRKHSRRRRDESDDDLGHRHHHKHRSTDTDRHHKDSKRKKHKQGYESDDESDEGLGKKSSRKHRSRSRSAS